MTLPNQTNNLQDPGLEKVEPLTAIPVFAGCSSGTATTSENTVYTYNTLADVVNKHGEGPNVEAACQHLSRCGGPIRFIEMTQSADGALGAFSNAGTGLATIVDNSSTPYNWFNVKIKVILGGALATATIQYSLDGGRSYSRTYTTAASFTIPNSGISLTLSDVPGDFVAGDVYTAAATGPIFTATEMDTMFAALRACAEHWDYGILTGRYADATTANTIHAALDADRTALPEPHKYKPWIMDAGGDNKATTLSGFTNTSKWIVPAYGTTAMVTPTPRPGYQTPHLPNYMFAIYKAGVTDLSEHWGRKASGPLPGVASWTTEFGSPLSHDEKADEGLDAAGFMTVGHYDGDPKGAYYVMRGRLKSPPDSDFTQWQYARTFSATFTIVHREQNKLIARSWATKPDGTLVEGEAKIAEKKIERAMRTLLHQKNVEGTVGHCSISGTDKGFFYTIDRDHNVDSTNKVMATWGVKPRAYGEYVESTGGFVTASA